MWCLVSSIELAPSWQAKVSRFEFWSKYFSIYWNKPQLYYWNFEYDLSHWKKFPSLYWKYILVFKPDSPVVAVSYFNITFLNNNFSGSIARVEEMHNKIGNSNIEKIRYWDSWFIYVFYSSFREKYSVKVQQRLPVWPPSLIDYFPERLFFYGRKLNPIGSIQILSTFRDHLS